MPQIPEISKKAGVEYFEHLDAGAVRVWLYAMLHDKAKIFAGGWDDYPVQAIVNTYPHLSLESQGYMSRGLENLLVDWIESTDGSWSETATRALLSLVAELCVLSAKSILQDLVWSQQSSPEFPLRVAVLRAIATLSRQEDHSFWHRVHKKYPEFTPMVVQVLSRTQ